MSHLRCISCECTAIGRTAFPLRSFDDTFPGTSIHSASFTASRSVHFLAWLAGAVNESGAGMSSTICAGLYRAHLLGQHKKVTFPSKVCFSLQLAVVAPCSPRVRLIRNLSKPMLMAQIKLRFRCFYSSHMACFGTADIENTSHGI